jgi:hypothetical protein
MAAMAMVWRGLAAVGALSLATALAACSHRPCEDVEEEARQLAAEIQACQPGDTCAMVNLGSAGGGSSCLAAFQCSTPVNVSQHEVNELAPRARKLGDERSTCGDECVYHPCAIPYTAAAFCNPATRRCELVPDGGAPDGS